MRLNHTIIHATDARKSATFLADLLGRPKPHAWGPFWIVDTDNGVSLDYDGDLDHAIVPQHYAFLISEADFDAVFSRVQKQGVRFWADPSLTREGEINRNDGGRAFYFLDPDRHVMEVLTVPYGGGR